MTREETIMILKLLKTAYPRFYTNITKEEAENTISLYMDMFKEENSNLVLLAVKQLITTLQFPPTIADVKNQIAKFEKNNDLMPIELWNKVKKAISNSSYNSEKEFNSLPPICQRWLGSPKTLREYAQNDSDTNNTVVKGQFLKQIETMREREIEISRYTPEIKSILGTIIKDVNLLEG